MSENKNYINRREFLVTGSLAVAAMSLPAVASAKTSAPSPLSLSIGFLGETSARFESADAVLSGDPTLFSRDARFSFRGMQRFASDLLQTSVDVLYRTDDGQTVPFFAFTHRETKKTVSNSSPSSFRVPVPTTGSIDLSVKAIRASSPQAEATVSFAVNSTGKSFKLNRGAYIYALSDRAVDWSAVRVADGLKASSYLSGGKPLLLRTNGGQDVNFDYIVMTVTAAAV